MTSEWWRMLRAPTNRALISIALSATSVDDARSVRGRRSPIGTIMEVACDG